MKILNILMFIYIQFVVYRASNYSIMSSECKKNNCNCDNCNCFLCPRFKLLHKEEDKK